MILSDRTVLILKNFSAINPSIVLKPGKFLHTKSPDGSLYAEAQISESFPEQEIAIFRLAEFVKLLTLDKKAVSKIEFGDDSALLKSGEAEIKYIYDDPTQIDMPKGKAPKVSPVETFILSKENLKQLLQMASTLKYEHVTLSIDEGKVSLKAHDYTSHFMETTAFDLEVPDCVVKNELKVAYILRLSHFKILPADDYLVAIHEDRRVAFMSKKYAIDYHMIAGKDSTLEQ